MRTIKFRAIGIDPSTEKRTGEWAYGYYEYDSYGSCHFISVTETNPELKQYNVLVDPSTVGQFTGLLDKDGKEIYEGDVLEQRDMNRYEKGIVDYRLSSFKIKWFDKICNHSEILHNNSSLSQVIGNIHDNPELLK